ncbi:hypothetical protein AAFF_G00329050 [Aldrovandia affinis]|uniref:Ig-like domain-containing protein n=1 Tax=Aldrovandia affinis TaxID=143900 RepID=A0AAD7WQU3_9TELE|nr:hypothetical protein AAFF_G00329050 [Aldrovandia affinis]
MTGAERFILIGCLLQGALGNSPPKPKLTPMEVKVTEGSSVNLSCSAAAPCPTLPQKLTWTPRLSDSVDQLQENQDQTKYVSSVLTFTASHLHHGQKITCTALYKLQQGDSQKTSKASLTLSILYPPKNTSVSVSPSGSVLEGSSVTLTCSSDANPPVQNYTWYKVNGRKLNPVESGHNLTFNVTEPSDSGQYYCEAQNEHGMGNSETVLLEIEIEHMPQISASGSCSRTAAEISCSCESRGNPSPSMEWRVSGLRVTNSTDRVIREEQLGNTGLRSSLTMRHSQGDTPTLLCLSTNTLSSSSLQLLIPSPEQHSNEDIYANHIMVTRRQREGEDHSETETQTQIQTEAQSQAADDPLHYASVKITACKTNQEPAAATNHIYGNVSCDRSRKGCSSNDSLIHPQLEEPHTQAPETDDAMYSRMMKRKMKVKI